MNDAESVRLERDALRAERDSLLDEVTRLRAPGERHLARQVIVPVLVVVAVMSALVATVGIWTERNVFDTDRYVQDVGPLARVPDVQVVLAGKLTDDLMDVVDPEAFIADALPEKGKVLAAPLAGAVENYVHDQVLEFMESARFEDLWLRANQAAHEKVVRAIKGQNPNVSTDGEKITINLIPLIDAALAHLGERSPELLGRSVDLPTLTVDDVPMAARAKLQRALRRPVGATFGEVTIYDDGELAALQSGVTTFERLRTISIVALLVSVPLGLWLSLDRRRTLLQLLVATSLGLILLRRVVLTVQEHVIELSQDPANQRAVRAATAVFANPLVGVIRWIVAGLLVLAIIAVLTGPYPWMVALRARVARFASALWHAITGAGGDGRATWVRSHQAETRIGVAIVAGIALWQLDLSWWGLLVLLVGLGALELVIGRMARTPVEQPAS